MIDGLKQGRVGRRQLLVGGLSAATLGFVAFAWTARRSRGVSPLSAAELRHAQPTLLAFMGALFGRRLSAEDRADLGDRLDLLQSDPTQAHDCDVLARCLDHFAKRRGAAAFVVATMPQQESIINEIMQIDPKTTMARLLMRVSKSEHEYFHMRWSAVPQLSWLYRHSSVAWRARGYHRWPGVSGDWHDILVPGPAYP